MKEIICITGELGSGKSTVGKMLAARLGYEFYSTGAAFREIAQKRGVTVYELNMIAETDETIDKEIDSKLAVMGNECSKIVVDSRMAWFFMKDSFKIRMTAELAESAHRVFNDNRTGCELYKSIDEAVEGLRQRRNAEIIRYMDKYGADITDNRSFNMVIDTTSLTPKECVDIILSRYDVYLKGF